MMLTTLPQFLVALILPSLSLSNFPPPWQSSAFFLTLSSSPGAPSTAPSPLPASLPNSKAASTKSKAAPILPDLHMSSSVLMAAAISVPLSILIAVCLAVRRCRKRGRGHLGGKESGGGRGQRGKDWGVGKLLKGRDREGFKPLDTEERDGMLDDDSDSEVLNSCKKIFCFASLFNWFQVEEFSIPANHA